MVTESITQTVSEVSPSADGGFSALLPNVLLGLAALLLIWLAAELSPKLARWVDSLFERITGKRTDTGSADPEKTGEYRVCDIYEGEKNPAADNGIEEKDNDNKDT